MQIAACPNVVCKIDDIPTQIVQKERRNGRDDEAKPDNIKEIVQGRIEKA